MAIWNQNPMGSSVGNQRPMGMKAGNQTTWNGYGAPPGQARVTAKPPPMVAGRVMQGYKPPTPTGNTADAHHSVGTGMGDAIKGQPHGPNPSATAASLGITLPTSITSNPLYQKPEVQAYINDLLNNPATGLAATVGGARDKIGSYQHGALYNLYQTHLQQADRDARHNGFSLQGDVNDRGFDNSGGLQMRLNQLGEDLTRQRSDLDRTEHQGQIDALNKGITDSKGGVITQIMQYLSGVAANSGTAQDTTPVSLSESNSAVAGDSALGNSPYHAPNPTAPVSHGGSSNVTPPQGPGQQKYAPKGWHSGIAGWFRSGNGKWNFINNQGTIQTNVPQPKAGSRIF